MITRLVLNGTRVAHDPHREWYALIEKVDKNGWTVRVYHPKDAPPDPPMVSCIAPSVRGLYNFLKEERWISRDLHTRLNTTPYYNQPEHHWLLKDET